MSPAAEATSWDSPGQIWHPFTLVEGDGQPERLLSWARSVGTRLKAFRQLPDATWLLILIQKRLAKAHLALARGEPQPRPRASLQLSERESLTPGKLQLPRARGRGIGPANLQKRK